MDPSLGERMTPHHILQRFFGYDTFRHHQFEVIEEALAGRDVFVLMPTGSGKSICFQVPSLIRRGVGLVISPLIALMQDQVTGLRQNGIRADYLNSSLPPDAARRVERRVLAGETDLLSFTVSGCPFCDRRGPLRFTVGARFSAGVPSNRIRDPSIPERSPHGADGHGRRGNPQGNSREA